MHVAELITPGWWWWWCAEFYKPRRDLIQRLHVTKVNSNTSIPCHFLSWSPSGFKSRCLRLWQWHWAGVGLSWTLLLSLDPWYSLLKNTSEIPIPWMNALKNKQHCLYRACKQPIINLSRLSSISIQLSSILLMSSQQSTNYFWVITRTFPLDGFPHTNVASFT